MRKRPILPKGREELPCCLQVFDTKVSIKILSSHLLGWFRELSGYRDTIKALHEKHLSCLGRCNVGQWLIGNPSTSLGEAWGRQIT